jgi:hypothetical protein
MSKSAVKTARAQAVGDGLSQQETEDLLAQVTSLQAKVSGFADRLALFGEQVREVKNGDGTGSAEAAWAALGAGAPRA